MPRLVVSVLFTVLTRGNTSKVGVTTGISGSRVVEMILNFFLKLILWLSLLECMLRREGMAGLYNKTIQIDMDDTPDLSDEIAWGSCRK